MTDGSRCSPCLDGEFLGKNNDSELKMNLEEFEVKLQNNELCRLCVGEESGEFLSMDDEMPKIQRKPKEIIEKFNLVELDMNLLPNVICQSCQSALASIFIFHQTATSAQTQLTQRRVTETQQTDPLLETQSTEEACSYETIEEVKEQESSDDTNSVISKSEINFVCIFCSKLFKNEPNLQKHIAKLHNNPEHLTEDKSRLSGQHSCPVCFKSFSSISNRNSHLFSHNPKNSVSCSECNQGFKSILYLRKHQKAIHAKVENECQICQKKFDTQQRFDYHMRTHEAVKRYRCMFLGCEKSFMQHHHLENHKTTHTGISKYLCFKCGKEFRQDCNLKAHLRTHDEAHGEEFKCTFSNCGKSFRLSSSFRFHQKTHSQPSSNSQCPECGKKFSQRSSLRAHFQIHFRDPNSQLFKCTQPGCYRSYHQERSLKCHIRSFHGIGERVARKLSSEKYCCDICPKEFKLQSLLKRHILTHIEKEQASRKHKCGSCEASFKRPEHLKLHVNSVHLKYKPHQCGFSGCNKSFTQIGDRNVHMKIHNDDKPHTCSICQKAFRLMKGLRAHEKIHAKDTVEAKVDVKEVVTATSYLTQPLSDVVLIVTLPTL